MASSLLGKKLGIIHAAVFTANTVKPYVDEFLPGVEVLHLGDDSIQQSNLKAPVGTIPKENFFKFATYAQFLSQAGCHLIMLACSTFNQAVEYAAPMISTPLLNIDRPMMDLALEQGGRIGLIGTLPSTMPSSERLLRKAAMDAGKDVKVFPMLCTEAFQALQAGDGRRHNDMLLEAVEALSRDVDAIVLAQVSMSVLEKELVNPRVPVFNSGRTGFAHAAKMLENMG